MNLVSEAGLDDWLAGLKGEPDEFDWDAGNRNKGRSTASSRRRSSRFSIGP
jgi:hypothetical protein